MGYRCRWIATRIAREAVLDRLGFSVRRELHARVCETGLWAVELPGGWTVVMGDGWDYMDLVSRAHAEALSAEGEVVFFFTDDSSMSAEVTVFQGGRLQWSFAYDGDQRQRELTGAPPPLVAETIAACEAKGAAQVPDAHGRTVDYVYDAPPQIALALLGFRHERTLSAGEHLPIYELQWPEPVEAAEPAEPPSASTGGFWKRLFGRT